MAFELDEAPIPSSPPELLPIALSALLEAAALSLNLHGFVKIRQTVRLGGACRCEMRVVFVLPAPNSAEHDGDLLQG